MDSVFFVFEMIGVVAFALSGAMWAIRQEMDVLGVCVLGATPAVGGGIVRDLMLGITPPTMLVNPTAALIAVGVSILIFLPFMQRLLHGGSNHIYERLMLLADSIGLAVFTVMGVTVGFANLDSPTVFACTFLGVLTGVWIRSHRYRYSGLYISRFRTGFFVYDQIVQITQKQANAQKKRQSNADPFHGSAMKFLRFKECFHRNHSFMQTSHACQMTVRRLPTLEASPMTWTCLPFLARGAGR